MGFALRWYGLKYSQGGVSSRGESLITSNMAEVGDSEFPEVLSAIDKTVLEMISGGAPFADVLQILSRTIEERSPGLLCSILLLDADGKTLRHGAAPSLPQDYVRAIDGRIIGPIAGSCGTAAFLGRAVAVSDIASDPLWAENRNLALSHGLRACWSTPFFTGDGQVLGTFAMYYREPRSPGSRDLQIIERATHLATIAVERERAEQLLRQVENRHRSFVDNAVEGFFQTTPSGGYVSVNPALARMYGYDLPSDLITAVGDIGHQVYVDPNRRAEFKRQMTAHGQVQGFEYQVYRKDGSKIWLSENARSVRDSNGALLYYEGTVVDVTEHKQLEDQLRQAQKMEAVGQLAGGVAHDFNNLLMVIQGNAEVMLEHLHPSEPLCKNANQIQKAAEQAASLTRQLLAFSRRQALQPKILDLNSITVEIAKMLPRLIGEDIDLRILTNASLGWVKADQSQIEQVLINLAVNARDAMPKGGRLTIETATVDLDESYVRQHVSARPGPYVVLAVRDTGVGMDAETQAHCFEPFFTTKEQGRGTGLGLATVYGVVKQSGGWIWVYSELGQGTTFKIYLPRVPQDAEAETHPTSLGSAPHGTETILVVEDQEGIRELARDFLASCGYEVLVASDGAEALKIAERHEDPIHLVLTDVVMPNLNGHELAQRLTASRPSMKILFMSGYTERAASPHDSLPQDAISLEKPFSLHMLATKVRQALESQTVAR
jgi:PAS domain S-box-containing protein